MSISASHRSGGGAATSGGVEYQARVAAWIAVSILTSQRSTPPWSLPADTRLEALWSETGHAVDDLLAATSAGGFVFLQAKRRLDLSSREGSEAAAAFAQIVRQFLQRGPGTAPGQRPIDLERDRLVLVTGRDSSQAVARHLPRLLERLAAQPRDHGVAVANNQAEEEALAALLELLRSAWRKHRGSPPQENEILQLAKVLQVHILDVEAGGVGEEQAKDRLRDLLIQPEQDGAAWAVLLQEALRLSSHRSGASTASLRRLLEKEGIALGGTVPSRLLSAHRLREISHAALPLQVQQLSREKYDPKLFIPRQQLAPLESFLDADLRFRAEAARLLDRLRRIATRFGLDRSGLDALLDQGPTPETVADALPGLEHAFRFDTVEKALSLANSAVRRLLEADFQRETKDLLLLLEQLPFLRRRDLQDAVLSLFALRQQFLLQDVPPEPTTFWSLLPHETPAPAGLANALLKALADLTRRAAGHCAAVVGRAGHGKTNLLCALAEELARDSPVFLLSGQMTISSEYEIEVHIQRWLERGLGRDCTGWLGPVSEALAEDGAWMYVLLDAVNENAEPGRMSRALAEFAARCRGRRIKLILSCRDILWPVFEPALRPALYGREPIPLGELTETEWRRAVKIYFERFDLRCRLGAAAERTLRNPLLLRLFCQAHQGQDLGEVQDLRVLDVFDQRIAHATAQITERSAFASPALIEDLLQRIGTVMWAGRRTAFRPSEVGITAREQSEPLSVYNQLRSEGLLADSPGEPSTASRSALDRPVQLLYEPFAEYVIASAWRASAGPGLVDAAVDALPTFAPTLGALLFLSRMRGPDSGLLRDVLCKMAARGDGYLAAQQPAVAAAFESLPLAEAGDDILDILSRFEALAAAESKNALAPVILRLFQSRREHPLLRSLALRLLEVDPALLAATPRERLSVSSTPALPPARHHYPQEARLTALSILVAAERETPDLFVEGVRKLGNADLHKALDAFRSLDRAADGVVLSVVEHQMQAGAPEYRIYCAWLLRERYGPRPAEVLVRLLTDPATRVHRYTFRLFRERRVEGDLVEAILALLESLDRIASWHLAPLLDLLSRPDRFEPANLLNVYGRRIAFVLNLTVENLSPVVRKTAYQGLLATGLADDPARLRQQMATDRSPSVQALAAELS